MPAYPNALMQATPRNALLGRLSDALAYTYSPERTQQAQMMAQFLGAPAISRTLDKMSYGEPLTTGAGGLGGTTRFNNDALETAMTIAPMVGPAARLAGKGAMATGRFVAPRAGQLAEQYMVKTGGILPLDVYHGTPHTLPPTARNPLGEFDASKIGSGEGAQAYGYGLYFAENPAVAEGYAKNLSNADKMNQGRLTAHANAQRLANLTGSPQYAADDIRFVLESNPDHEQKKLLTETLNFLESGDYQKPLENKGNLYKIDLPDEKIAKMLDWDKPLKDQTPEIRELAKQYGLTDADHLGGDLVAAMNAKRATGANTMRQAGIPGIKYLDEQSRNAGGTRNFVVFPGEEKSMTILERNGQKFDNSALIGAKFTAPQDEALRLAQQRAALPPSQGGLGLPAGNTPEQRAAAMGGKEMTHFSRHGGDFSVLDSGQYAQAPFDAVGTHVGSKEAALERFRNTIGTTDQIKGVTYPVNMLGKNPLMNPEGHAWTEDELSAFLRKEGGHNVQGNLTYSQMNAELRKKLFEDQGYTSIPYVNEVENKGVISHIVPPENLRSRFAAFDPWRKTAAIAATMGVAAPDLLAGQSPKQAPKFDNSALMR